MEQSCTYSFQSEERRVYVSFLMFVFRVSVKMIYKFRSEHKHMHYQDCIELWFEVREE